MSVGNRISAGQQVASIISFPLFSTLNFIPFPKENFVGFLNQVSVQTLSEMHHQ